MPYLVHKDMQYLLQAYYLTGTILRDKYYYYFHLLMKKLSPKEAKLPAQDHTTTK